MFYLIFILFKFYLKIGKFENTNFKNCTVTSISINVYDLFAIIIGNLISIPFALATKQSKK